MHKFCTLTMYLSLITLAVYSIENIADAPDSIDNVSINNTNSYSEFQYVRNLKTNLIKCGNIFNKAIENGYKVDDKEFKFKTAFFNKIFPNSYMHNFEIEQVVILEKYIQDSLSLWISPVNLDNEYDAYKKAVTFKKNVDQNELEIFLKFKVALGTDEILQLSEKLENDRIDLKQDEHKIHYINTELLRIQGNEKECLVTDPSNSICLVTIGNYNTFCLLRRVPADINIEEAQSLLLRELIRKLYFQSKLESVFISNKDSLYSEENNKLESRLLINEFSNDEKIEFSENEYDKIYEKYYQRFFSGRKSKVVAILGSQDSLYIDSIYRNMRQSAHNPTKNFKVKSRYLNSLKWNFVYNNDLDINFKDVIDSLRIQQYAVINTNHGFFLCRIVSEKFQQSLNRLQAYHKLRYLLSQEQKLYRGKSDSIIEIEYYQQNISKFTTPDTFHLITWLIPENDSATSKSLNKKSLDELICKDTSENISRVLISTNLPEKIEKIVTEKFETDNDNFLGPIYSCYGKWYFKKINKITGKKQLTFDDVRAKIKKGTGIQTFPYEELLNTEEGKRLQDREASSAIYQNYTWDKLNHLTDKEVENNIDGGKIIISKEIEIDAEQCNDLLKQQFVKIKLERAEENKINNWIASLKIESKRIPWEFQSEKIDF